MTPLSLLYIGIVLAKAGLKTIRFDTDTIVTLVGRFILAPATMYFILKFAASGMATKEFNTFVVQSAAPALAVLPILAEPGRWRCGIFHKCCDIEHYTLYNCRSDCCYFIGFSIS